VHLSPAICVFSGLDENPTELLDPLQDARALPLQQKPVRYPDPFDPTAVDNSMISYYFNIVRAQVPVRMLYTQKELDINSENVQAAIDKTGVPYNSEFIMDARIFWDVK